MRTIDINTKSAIEDLCHDTTTSSKFLALPSALGLKNWGKIVDGEDDRWDAEGDPEATINTPRSLIDLVKAEIMKQQQEEMLQVIRGSPGWGCAQGSTSKSGNLLVHDTYDSSLGIAPQATTVLIRCGAKGLETKQVWKRRYVVLTPEKLELFCIQKRSIHGSKRLTRTLQRRLTDLVEVRRYSGLTPEALALLKARTQERTMTGEEEGDSSVDTGSEPNALANPLRFELVFRDMNDAWSLDVVSMSALTAAEADDWVTLAETLQKTALEASLEEDPDEAQTRLDELEDAFEVISSVVDDWLERLVLPRPALELLMQCAHNLTGESQIKFDKKMTKYKSEPQASALFDIKEKYRSTSNWKQAIKEMNRMNVDGDALLPSSLAQCVLNVVDAIYGTYTTEHPDEDLLAADEMFPILVFILIRSKVVMLPVYVTMMMNTLEQNSKAAYYVTTFHACITYIGDQLGEERSSASVGADADLRLSTSSAAGARLSATTSGDSPYEPEPEFDPTSVTAEVEFGGETKGKCLCELQFSQLVVHPPDEQDRVIVELAVIGKVLRGPSKCSIMLQVEGTMGHFLLESAASCDAFVDRIKEAMLAGGASPRSEEVAFDVQTPAKATASEDGSPDMSEDLSEDGSLDESTIKLKLVFVTSDADCDGFLNHSDLLHLAKLLGEEEGFPEEAYTAICNAVNADPLYGLDIVAMEQVYAAGMCDLERDFQTLGLKLPGADKPTAITNSAMKRSNRSLLKQGDGAGGGESLRGTLMVASPVASRSQPSLRGTFMMAARSPEKVCAVSPRSEAQLEIDFYAELVTSELCMHGITPSQELATMNAVQKWDLIRDHAGESIALPCKSRPACVSCVRACADETCVWFTMRLCR